MDGHVKNTVIRVVSRITGNKVENIDLESDLKTQLTLDSVQLVELFAALEKELNVELPLKMMTVRTGRAFFDMLEEVLKK